VLKSVAAALMALPLATSPALAAEIIVSPTPLPASHDRPRVFLGGSIEMGVARDWQADLIAALDSADVIVMYLAPGTQSPISLLELGLHGRSGKVVLLCPDGFWRKGNVDITAERYGITRVTAFEDLVSEVRARLKRWKPE
jgi:hypothetical protein